jgi:hypothetical protein
MNPSKLKNILRDKVKKYGWKAFVGIFVYYLIRDITLYLVLPYFAFNF